MRRVVHLHVADGAYYVADEGEMKPANTDMGNEMTSDTRRGVSDNNVWWV